MISIYPTFQKIALEHKEEIERFVERFPPYSDFNFTSMWTYNTEDALEISMLNDNLVVQFTDYITNKPFLSFIGNNQVEKTIDELLAFSKSKTFPSYLKLIPHSVVEGLLGGASQYNIVEDTDNNDYILSVQEIAELKGGKYSDKRNLVNRFNKNYPQALVKVLDITEQSVQTQMRKLFWFWSNQSNKTKEESDTEMKAIERLFELAPTIKCYAMGVYDKDELVGFITFELTHQEHGIMSFAKGDKTYEGIYSVLNHEASKLLFSLHYKYINYEQDLGIPGLRKAKLLWRPIHFLKKYIISPINTV